MGCGASKEDVVQPRSMRSHGRSKLNLKNKEAVPGLKPNEIACALDGSQCICSLYNNIPSAELNNHPTPPSVFVHTSDESPDSSDEDEDEDDESEDFRPSFAFPSKLSVVEEDNSNAAQTTALAALSGEKAVSDKELEERVEAILAADGGELIFHEQSEECCALGSLSQSAIIQALLSTGPAISQKFLGSDLTSTRVKHLAVISGPEPIRWETPLRKAEIIDLDEEPNSGESLMVENTPEQQENQSDQESADAQSLKQEDSDSTEKEQSRQYPKPLLPEVTNAHKTLSGPEPRKGKLPPLTIVPPILVEIQADPFAKPAFPMVIKQDLMVVKVPGTEQFEDLSTDRTPPLALELADSPSPNELDNHEDKRSKSSLVTEHCEDGTPTPATKSSAGSGWRSPHRDLPMDPDIENIVLLGSPEQDNQQLPLISMLDCHGIHMDKKDLISPSLRLIS